MLQDTITSKTIFAASTTANDSSAETQSGIGFAKLLNGSPKKELQSPARSQSSSWNTVPAAKDELNSTGQSTQVSEDTALPFGENGLVENWRKNGNSAVGTNVADVEVRSKSAFESASSKHSNVHFQNGFNSNEVPSSLEGAAVDSETRPDIDLSSLQIADGFDVSRPGKDRVQNPVQELQKLGALHSIHIEADVSMSDPDLVEHEADGAKPNEAKVAHSESEEVPGKMLLELDSQLMADKALLVGGDFAPTVGEARSNHQAAVNISKPILETIVAREFSSYLAPPNNFWAGDVQIQTQLAGKIGPQTPQPYSPKVGAGNIQADSSVVSGSLEIESNVQTERMKAVQPQHLPIDLKNDPNASSIPKPEVSSGNVATNNSDDIAMTQSKHGLEVGVVKPSMDAGLQNLSQPAQTLAKAIQENSNWSNVLTSPTVRLAQIVKSDGTALQSMRVQLNPVELGKVDLNLRIQNGQLQIDVRVETEETYRALLVDHSVLTNTLKSLGYRVENIFINGPNAETGSLAPGFSQSNDQRFYGEENGKRAGGRSEYLNEFDSDSSHAESADQDFGSRGTII